MQINIQNNLRTLGSNEALLALSLCEQGKEVVNTRDITSLLNKENTSRKVVHNLLRKGWLTRLKGGRYLFLPPEYGPKGIGENNPFVVASALVDVSYIGWWSAASFHGLTTQRPMVITVAALQQLPARIIEDTKIQFTKVVPRKFFGYKNYNVYQREVRFSTPVKTVVDCIDRPDLAGGCSEVTRIFYEASTIIDPGELFEDSLKMKSIALLQRIGFLADLIKWELPLNIREKIRDAIPTSTRSTFGRSTRKEGDIGYVKDWGLIVHATASDLLAEVKNRKLC